MMPTLPADNSSAIYQFTSLFSKRVWKHVETLLIGAILAPAQRTVTAVLRVMGRESDEHFTNFHRVLNRDHWSPLAAARRLLGLVVATLVPEGVILTVLDDTIERRRGKRIGAKGVYRDAVRSSKSHVAKATGLRWVCLGLIAQVPFAARRWALPVLTALAPSERCNRERGRRHRKITEWGRGLLLQLHRWLPQRTIICVADSGYASLEFLDSVRSFVTLITRLRLDAALFEPAPTFTGEKRPPGRPRRKGAAVPKLQERVTAPRKQWKRLRLRYWYQEHNRRVEVQSGTAVWYHTGMPVVPIRWVLVRDPERRFRTEALLSTDLALSSQQILEYYVERWSIEVTFEESRAHLGIETQRQWSQPAIERTTPTIFSLFTIVTLMACDLNRDGTLGVRQTAWYSKEHPTFSDAIAGVRAELWRNVSFSTSPPDDDIEKVPRKLYGRLVNTIAYGS